MNKKELLERERKLKEFSNIRLKRFKEEFHYDLDSLRNLIDRYCKSLDSEVLRKSIKVSLRKAMVAVFESRLIKEVDEKRDRDSYKSRAIIADAIFIYNIANREKRNFPTLKETHPKDPNAFFDKNQQRLSYYKTTLIQIMINRAWMLKEDKNQRVFQSFESIYDAM